MILYRNFTVVPVADNPAISSQFAEGLPLARSCPSVPLVLNDKESYTALGNF